MTDVWIERPYEPIRLGALIDALSRQSPGSRLYFDFCDLRPRRLDSYRGFYDQLAVGYDTGTDKTVGQFLEECRACVGAAFEGYKGGSYVMSDKTCVWVANYGESHSTGIVGVEMGSYEGATILITSHIW